MLNKFIVNAFNYKQKCFVNIKDFELQSVMALQNIGLASLLLTLRCPEEMNLIPETLAKTYRQCSVFRSVLSWVRS